MLTLLLKFRINLEEYTVSTEPGHYGPLFHRWLPNGEKDAVFLDTGDSDVQLKVWFERHGYQRNDFIEFDPKRQEVEPETMRKQAVLEGGPLLGLLEIKGLLDYALAPLRAGATGDEGYITLGKRVVKLIHGPLARFIDILRKNYGQYWIRPLEKWDSRRESLGRYCSSPLRLGLQWSIDGGQTWAPFMPNEPTVHLTLTMLMDRSYREYLTEADWQELAKAFREGYQPPLAAHLISQAHQLLDQGNLKHAFIEGVTALEVALDEFMRQKLNDDFVADSVQSFWGLRLATRVIPVLVTLGTVPLQDMKDTIKAIDMRNKVVHDGWNPPESAKNELSGLLNAAAALIPGPRFRFPTINPGNKIMPLEDWERLAKEDDRGG